MTTFFAQTSSVFDSSQTDCYTAAMSDRHRSPSRNARCAGVHHIPSFPLVI